MQWIKSKATLTMHAKLDICVHSCMCLCVCALAVRIPGDVTWIILSLVPCKGLVKVSILMQSAFKARNDIKWDLRND